MKCLRAKLLFTLTLEWESLALPFLSLSSLSSLENKFENDDMNVRGGINPAIDMNNVIVLKAAYHLMRKQISYNTIVQEGTRAISEGEKYVKHGRWNRLLNGLLTIEWYSSSGSPKCWVFIHQLHLKICYFILCCKSYSIHKR